MCFYFNLGIRQEIQDKCVLSLMVKYTMDIYECVTCKITLSGRNPRERHTFFADPEMMFHSTES